MISSILSKLPHWQSCDIGTYLAKRVLIFTFGIVVCNEETKAKVVWACVAMCHGHQDFPKQYCKAQCRDGGRRRGRQRRRLEDNIISDWTGVKLFISETFRMRGMEGDGC